MWLCVCQWHLGFYQEAFTPWRRGFDVFTGYLTGNEEYWNHTSPCYACGNYTAYDLTNATSDGSVFEHLSQFSGVYSTNLFGGWAVDTIEGHSNISKPLFLYLPFEAVHGAASCEPNCENPPSDILQAPQKYIDAQSQIPNMVRRTFAGMVGALDEAVANITAALQRRGMWNNTLLIFTTDNGAPSTHFNGEAMSNFPLRGGKVR